MVQDVTNPAFLGEKLEPAFLQIKVSAAKKQRRSVTKKDRGPRWVCSGKGCLNQWLTAFKLYRLQDRKIYKLAMLGVKVLLKWYILL